MDTNYKTDNLTELSMAITFGELTEEYIHQIEEVLNNFLNTSGEKSFGDIDFYRFLLILQNAGPINFMIDHLVRESFQKILRLTYYYYMAQDMPMESTQCCEPKMQNQKLPKFENVKLPPEGKFDQVITMETINGELHEFTYRIDHTGQAIALLHDNKKKSTQRNTPETDLNRSLLSQIYEDNLKLSENEL